MNTRTDSQIRNEATNIKRKLEQINRELENKKKSNRNIDDLNDTAVLQVRQRQATLKLQLGKLSEELQQITRTDHVRNRRQDLGETNVTQD